MSQTRVRQLAIVGVVAAALSGTAAGQNRIDPVGANRTPRGGYNLPPLPAVFETFEQKLRVSVVARGLDRPWSLLILPDGEMLVSMRYAGQLRAIRKGVLDPIPVAGLPDMRTMFDIVMHPKYADNHLLYFGYSKKADGGRSPVAIARGRYEGGRLTDVTDVFLTDPTGNGASRMAFAPDGTLYMTISGAGGRIPNGPDPRKLDTDYGKVIRVNDDGTIPKDNPFVGREGARPEVFSLGHRDHFGIAPHPVTGQMFHVELGPYGGDKVNILKAGGDYGWPDVGWGRNNDSSPLGSPVAPGIEQPLLVWLPGITPSGLLFYTGDKFPAWRNNLIVGSVVRGRVRGASGIERVVFNDKMWETRRETFLTELKQRMRDVRQGPDGLIYLLTEEIDGAVLRLEPVD